MDGGAELERILLRAGIGGIGEAEKCDMKEFRLEAVVNNVRGDETSASGLYLETTALLLSDEKRSKSVPIEEGRGPRAENFALSCILVPVGEF